ncbi:unnamed protein product [Rhizopus stolonifer]
MSSKLEEIIKKLHEQNSEIIKHNIRLNQKLTLVENKMFQLQVENLKLKIENKQLKPTKASICLNSQDKTSKEGREKRRCTNKINYALPNVKSKLRKGDPHTFETKGKDTCL